MLRVSIRFYEELNEYLPHKLRKVEFERVFEKTCPLEELIDSFGIPLAEVDLILANGESVDASYSLKDNDRISIYPVFESLDISSLTRLRSRPLRDIRFVADKNLDRLSGCLRALGFDAKCPGDASHEELQRISREEGRILLTDEAVPSDRSRVTHAYRIRAISPWNQVREIAERFHLELPDP